MYSSIGHSKALGYSPLEHLALNTSLNSPASVMVDPEVCEWVWRQFYTMNHLHHDQLLPRPWP